MSWVIGLLNIAVDYFILTEDGDYILTEDGDQILLETTGGAAGGVGWRRKGMVLGVYP